MKHWATRPRHWARPRAPRPAEWVELWLRGACALVVGGLVAVSCTVDFSKPVDSVCGDGVVEGAEQCDGEQLAGLTCQLVGFEEGTLSCSSDCRLSLGECIGGCGNGAVEGAEECDNGDDNSDTQPDACRLSCRLPVCGDGVVDTGEYCDRPDTALGCDSLALGAGELGCDTACLWDTADCELGGACGNAVREAPEQCDGTDLGFATCENLNLGVGSLSCSQDCLLDTAGCTLNSECGDGVIVIGIELCDGSELGGQTCLGLGLGEGTLGCSADCQDYDTAGCRRADGEPCTMASQCGSLWCGTEANLGWPQGHCLRGCDQVSCPGTSVCVEVAEVGEPVCLRSCASSGDCRPGYACFDRGATGETLCWPHCETALDCQETGFCNRWINRCGITPAGEMNGIVCTDGSDCASGQCDLGWTPVTYCTSLCNVTTGICPNDDICSDLASGTQGDLGHCLDACVNNNDCSAAQLTCIANPWGAGEICHP